MTIVALRFLQTDSLEKLSKDMHRPSGSWEVPNHLQRNNIGLSVMPNVVSFCDTQFSIVYFLRCVLWGSGEKKK